MKSNLQLHVIAVNVQGVVEIVTSKHHQACDNDDLLDESVVVADVIKLILQVNW